MEVSIEPGKRNWLVQSFLEIKQTWDMFAVFDKYTMSKAWSTSQSKIPSIMKVPNRKKNEASYNILRMLQGSLLQIIVKIECNNRSMGVIMCTSVNRSRRDNIQASGEANTKTLSGWKGQTVLGKEVERNKQESWGTWMEPGGGTPSGRLAI